jgi:hypothetical protein
MPKIHTKMHAARQARRGPCRGPADANGSAQAMGLGRANLQPSCTDARVLVPCAAIGLRLCYLRRATVHGFTQRWSAR